jgi:hypothetical protein
MPTITGTTADDTLIGTVQDDVIHGLGGNDVLRSGGGGRDQIFGDAGDDLFQWGRDEYNLVRFDGGEGFDTLDLTQFFITGGPQTLSSMSVERGDDDQTLRVSVIFRGPSGPSTTYVVVEATSIERLLVNQQISVNLIGYARPIEVVGGAVPVYRSIVGTSGADRLVGDSRLDAIFGDSGDDFLIGDAGNDQLNGGAGIDTAGYFSLVRSYVVTRGSGGFTGVSGGVEGGADTLTSVERLSFLDGAIYTDADSAAAQIYRLYDAALDRGPDQAGLSGWVGRLAEGATLDQAAQAFATAPEFVQRYGSLSNEDFVKTMYRLSLNREGDAWGISQWTAQLDSGVSRGSVLLSFSESVEHRNIIAQAVNAGIFVQDDRTIAVARLYDAAFDRVPDLGGIAHWRGTLETGGSLLALANAFVSSQEFQDRYGALNNTQFIDQLYRFALNRSGDPGGVQNWVNHLNNGMGRAEVLNYFSESAEHVALTAQLWLGGVRYQGYQGSALPTINATGLTDHIGATTSEALVIQDPHHGSAQVGAGFIEGGYTDWMMSLAEDAFILDVKQAPLTLDTHSIDAVGYEPLTLPGYFDADEPGSLSAKISTDGDHAWTLFPDELLADAHIHTTAPWTDGHAAWGWLQ